MTMNLLNNLIKESIKLNRNQYESIKLNRNQYYMLQSLQLITNLTYKDIFHPIRKNSATIIKFYDPILSF